MPSIDERVFNDNADWRDFYGDVAEELPPNMPEPKGKHATISCFVDANHAGNVITRRSHTGIIVYVQNAPIIWFSKCQNTVESSSFGSEFVALRTAKDMIGALRYKLRMFGVPIVGPANVVTIMVSSRIRQFLNQCWRRSITQSITMRFAGQLQLEFCVLVRKMG